MKSKKKLARKLSGKQTNAYLSPEWDERKQKIAERVLQKQKPKQ